MYAQHNRGMHGPMVLYVMLSILLIPSPRRMIRRLIHICTYFWNWFIMGAWKWVGGGGGGGGGG